MSIRMASMVSRLPRSTNSLTVTGTSISSRHAYQQGSEVIDIGILDSNPFAPSDGIGQTNPANSAANFGVPVFLAREGL
jgi:hypothetical protein